jgi:hypothetical protein
MEINMKNFLILWCCFFSVMCIDCIANESSDLSYSQQFENIGEIQTDGYNFYFHQGNNVWSSMKYDDLDPIPPGLSFGYEKKWRCPYCYYWWPYGQKCANPACPTNQWF